MNCELATVRVPFGIAQRTGPEAWQSLPTAVERNISPSAGGQGDGSQAGGSSSHVGRPLALASIMRPAKFNIASDREVGVLVELMAEQYE